VREARETAGRLRDLSKTVGGGWVDDGRLCVVKVIRTIRAFE
jgi:hypothetical protein